MDNQTLQVLIEASAEKAKKAVNELKTSISGLGAVLKGATRGITEMGTAIYGLGKTGLAKVINTIDKLLDTVLAASDRAEELNLFNVVFKNIEVNGKKTFSTLGKEATRFQYKLNEAFGTNMTDTMRYQALFQSMGENAGIKDKYASIMSENLTKLTYDLASLYNRSEKETAEALKSGIYAGQTKPMRKYGVDVTQGSISPLLNELGITDRTISQMSQAEKEILRYIGTMRQAQVAMKDFAQTIESPANQLKVLRNQFAELKVAIGNLFLGLFAQILPYANAILMVLKELAKAIASFFGIEIRDYNSGLGALEETEDGWNDIGAGTAKATKAAKEYKKQILSFDQIHNLTSPTKSSSGSGGGSGGVSGGIDKRLLQAIKGYDNMMDKVRMKATEIRDRWMQILGFKKVINPLTGEVSFKYKGFATTVKNLANQFSKLSSKAKLFIGLGLTVAIAKLITKAKTLLGVIGSSGLLTSTKDLFSWMKLGVQVEGSLTKGLKEGVQAWREQKGIIGENTTAFGRITSGVTEFTKGLGLAAGSMLLLNSGLEDMKENGVNVFNSMETLGGVLGTTFGAAQMGAVFGPWGAAIGGGIGLIGSLITAISGISEAFDEEQVALDKSKEQVEKDWEEMKQYVEDYKDSISNVDSELGYYQGLKDELDSIVDKNGKIKEGYEERAKVITGILADAFGVEITIVDGVIQKYDKLSESIDNLILEKRAMAKLELVEERWKKAIQDVDQQQEKLNEKYAAVVKMYREQDKVVESLANKYGLTTEQARMYIEALDSHGNIHLENEQQYKDLKNLQEKYKDFTKTLDKTKDKYDEYNDKIYEAEQNWGKQMTLVEQSEAAIKTYETAYSYVLDKNYETLDDYLKKEGKLLEKEGVEFQNYNSQLERETKKHKEELLKHQDEYSKEEFDKLLAADERVLKHIQEQRSLVSYYTLDSQGKLTEEYVQKWRDMGKNSEEEFIKQFQRLPRELQDELYDRMTQTGSGLSQHLKEGLDKVRITKTIEIKAKDNATSTIKGIIGNLSKSFPDLGKLLSGKTKGGVYTARGWSNIPQYANGGSPSHGTLFAAGENGAEIVGNINRRTEVLNRSQIATAIYDAVASAMSNASLGGGEVHLYAHTDEGVIIDRINQKTKQTGRCPINIPA